MLTAVENGPNAHLGFVFVLDPRGWGDRPRITIELLIFTSNHGLRW